MSFTPDIIRFHRDCYAYDYRSFSIRNFFGRGAQFPYVLERNHAFAQDSEGVLADPIWGEKVVKEVAINGKEKTLYAGALFLMGTVKSLGKTVRVAPPLLLFEAHLEKIFKNYRLTFDLENPIVNPFFVEMINGMNKGVELSYEEFSQGFPPGPYGVAEIVAIETWLEKQIPFLDISGLQTWYTDYKQIENARYIYKLNRDEDQNRLIAGISVGLLKKQEGSRGVINELNELSNLTFSDNTLQHLLQQSNKSVPNLRLSPDTVPIPLSRRQNEVFENVSQNAVSLVIGPPGTGKSYTIAALVTALIANNNSVLVASKNWQSGKVIVDKIEQDIGIKGMLIKAARQSYRKHLINKIDNLLSGMQWKKTPSHEETVMLREEIKVLKKRIITLQSALKQRETEESNWARFFSKNRNGFFDKFRKKWIEYKHSNAEKIWKLKAEIDKIKKRKTARTKSFIKKRRDWDLYNSSQKYRKSIVSFKNLLINNKPDDFAKLKTSEFESILKLFPAWVVKANDVDKVIPLRNEVFDVLIIDEATQCDVSSSLPLIFRAKRIVIIGDPKQLRHISFLSKAREKLLNDQNKINGWRYRDFSILDLVQDQIKEQSQITFLNEHFRSLPDIISFSNEKFYGGNLYLMTASPIANILKNLYINQVDGKRNAKGENIKEVQAIISKVKSVIKAEKDLEKKLKSTIGIISPFRAQVNLIKSKIRSALTVEEIRSHEILIGTPFHFQGEEKDVMLLSFALDSDTHSSTYRYLNRPDVFNVSITRARSVQIVYISVQVKELDHHLLLSEYLTHIEAPRLPEEATDTLSEHDRFSEEVESTLKNWNVSRILLSHAVSGVYVDLVVVNNGKSYCIDLIGYPGEYASMLDPDQINMLDRMGHPIFLLPYSEWHLNREKTIDSLHAFLFPERK